MRWSVVFERNNISTLTILSQSPSHTHTHTHTFSLILIHFWFNFNLLYELDNIEQLCWEVFLVYGLSVITANVYALLQQTIHDTTLPSTLLDHILHKLHITLHLFKEFVKLLESLSTTEYVTFWLLISPYFSMFWNRTSSFVYCFVWIVDNWLFPLSLGINFSNGFTFY
jgi:hypothetical protein